MDSASRDHLLPNLPGPDPEILKNCLRMNCRRPVEADYRAEIADREESPSSSANPESPPKRGRRRQLPGSREAEGPAAGGNSTA
jgi:hypothetical protein